MSSIARWSYANTAIIKPFVSRDPLTGANQYGPEYTIFCTWEAGGNATMTAQNGDEFIAKHIIYTEDAGPRVRDMIRIGGRAQWEEIRSVTEWDMSMFADVPDFKLATG